MGKKALGLPVRNCRLGIGDFRGILAAVLSDARERLRRSTEVLDSVGDAQAPLKVGMSMYAWTRSESRVWKRKA